MLHIVTALHNVIFEILFAFFFECLPDSLREGYECLLSEKPKLYYHTLGTASELSFSLDIRIVCISQAIPSNFPKHWMFVWCFACI